MDILWVQKQDGTLEPLHPFCFYDFLEDIPELKRYQVVQTSPKSLWIYLVPLDGKRAQSLRVGVDKELRAMLEQKGLLEEVSYNLEIVQEIPREQKSLKFKPIVSLGYATGPL